VTTNVKDLLYSAINEMGMEKIRIDVSSDINMCEKYCTEIIKKCSSRLGCEANDETIASLCEALLHFMLTATLLSSERKVSVQGADLDVVVPSTRILARSPDRSLVIQVVRDDLGAKLKQAKSVQPHRENIWLVSSKQLQTRHRNYNPGPGSFPYSRIISDISAFLTEKGDCGLKLLQGQ
jgi:hypothetical protein